MDPISYTITPQILAELQESETVKTQVLTKPLSAEQELMLRFQATVERVHFLLEQHGVLLPVPKIAQIIKSEHLKRQNEHEQSIKNRIYLYTTSLRTLEQHWSVTTKEIHPEMLITMYEDLGMTFRGSSRKLSDFLSYLQAQHDNPIIQSAIAYIGIQRLAVFTDDNQTMGTLTSLLFLLKSGYDMRRMLSLERYFRLHPGALYTAIEQMKTEPMLTQWLAFYTHAFTDSLHGLLHQIQLLRYHAGWHDEQVQSATMSNEDHLPRIRLSRRQKEILSLFDIPDQSITNRFVQKHFDISQITASRELARLRNVGLLYQHGKGRSTYYTNH